MVKISSWGRLGHYDHEALYLADRHAAPPAISAARPGLPHGLGRSYGDVCLNPGGALWLTRGLDRFIAFDEESGLLRCEAGLSLRELQQLTLPRGWALPVTPGTEEVTVGGAIANDVHGKNHHGQGSFGDHVSSLKLARSDGSVHECGPGPREEPNAALFAATVGGLGLTGLILEAELRLRRVPGPWMSTETLAFRNLRDFFELAEVSEAGWEYTVAWIDCSTAAQRGLFFRGNHSERPGNREPRRPLHLPLGLPFSPLNRLTLAAFNSLYFHRNKRRGAGIRHYRDFFYPLDGLGGWNRLYGPRGFYQYQCLVPREGGENVIAAMLHAIRKSGQGSILAVLKTFGPRQPKGMLSFPGPGVTLALDFPNKGEDTLKLFTRLDTLVQEAGGRLYAAKDARMPRELFEAGYPRLSEFLPHRDPGISSAFSRRMLGS